MAKAKKALKLAKKVEILKLTASDNKVIETIRNFRLTAEAVKGEVEKGMSVFQKAYRALAECEPKKWNMILTEAGITDTSSYRSTLKRAALDPAAADEKLLTTGSINKAIALLPTQEAKTASGSTKKGGRPTKSAAQRTKEQTLKCLGFLVSNYEVEDILKMVKDYAAKNAKAAEKATGDEPEE